MAFSSTRTGYTVFGNRKKTWGTFTNAATDSGGEIATGLRYVENCHVDFNSHLGTEVPKVTLNSATNGAVTIVTSTGADGTWEATGI